MMTNEELSRLANSIASAHKGLYPQLEFTVVIASVNEANEGCVHVGSTANLPTAKAVLKAALTKANELCGQRPSRAELN